MKIIQLTNSTPTQMMGYVIVASTGEVLVVDGGNTGDKDELKRVIKSVGGHVDLWLITHPHGDHHDAIIALLQDPDGITYDKLGASQLPDSWAEAAKVDDVREFLTWNTFAVNLDERYFNVKTGQRFTLGSMTVEVLSEANPEILKNPINNQSAVFRVTEGDFTLLMLGDLGIEAGEKLIATGQDLRADGVQMAHHGQQGVNEEFYKRVQPTYCFWATPEWLWFNRNYLGGGEKWGGPFKTPETASWMEKMNTVNILNFDYTVVFDTETKEVKKY